KKSLADRICQGFLHLFFKLKSVCNYLNAVIENKGCTMVYNFKNDYTEGVHPNILDALKLTNPGQQEGYGDDKYCHKAIHILRHKIGNPFADIHFVSGGTQANAIVIASVLKPYESVISASTGHINVHEAGAVENTGHKINVVESINGKLSCEGIQSVLDKHIDEHMVKPRLVFISNATETGTIYKKKELEALCQFCKSKELLLYLDGARIGCALCSEENDLTLAELSRFVDLFYIGGTKNGAMLGEAVIINNNSLKDGFRFFLKQNGALLAKSRIFGVQFVELFKDDLFFELAKHANAMALKLSRGIEKIGFQFLSKSATNQIFPIFNQDIIKRLSKKYGFYVWENIDDNKVAIRLVTSWATKEEAVDSFISDLRSLKN
ncbi:MAG: aminotransferase class V-fold PLP-dependent enzyme, partial [Desulfobacula sp.]|nr:aminotransferase class V-fold PLP-dependent enzyme [Desulfobacula sp.]